MIVLRNLKNTLHLPYNINIKYAYLQIAKIKIICLNKFFKDNNNTHACREPIGSQLGIS